jgi:hypothetical protein
MEKALLPERIDGLLQAGLPTDTEENDALHADWNQLDVATVGRC